MAKLRINGDSSGYVDLEAPNAASSSTLDLDQVPQKNAANTFSAVNNFTNSVAIGTSSPAANLHVYSSGQAIARVEGVNQYYVGMMIKNNYSSTQSQWHVAAAGGTSGWGAANGNFIIRDDTTNSTGLEIEQGAGSNTAALHINSLGYVTMPAQPAFGIESSHTYSVAATGEQVFNSSTVYSTATNIRANIGSHWSSSTGRFTAPVAGSYSFTFNVDIKSQTSGYMLIRIRKNGSQMVGIYPDQTSPKERVTLNTVLTLATGDYIDVSWNNNYTTPVLSYASFSGFLIG